MADGHYQVLARKWRPQTFEDVVGQEHVTRTLRNAIQSGRIGHAFLFIGSRGIGKTTSARILAKALNCRASDGPTPDPCGECDNCRAIAAGNSIDVIEIDGASNNSVEDVRQIRENVRMSPSSCRYKIYIIDEVHQLSLPAFNALLKTLEEPPAHAVFILATTEAHKVPATIISRCQRYDFRRVGLDSLVALLRKIVEAEGMKADDDALYAIARAADGGVRDAESILDQLMSYCDTEIAFQDVFDVLGLVDWAVLHTLCDAIENKDVSTLLSIVENVVVSGKDLGPFVQDILRYFRNLLVCRSGGPRELLALPDEEVEELRARAARFSLTELIRLVEQFAELLHGFDSQLAQRTALEALLIRISRQAVDVSVDTVLEKIAALQEQLNGGETPALAAPPAAGAKKKSPPVAKTASAPRAKPVATAANLDIVWRAVAENAAAQSLALGAFLPYARPVDIDGDRLILEIDGARESAAKAFDSPECRAVVEAALAGETGNLRGYVVRRVTAAPAAAPAGNVTIPGNAVPAAFREAEADPGVAKVIDVFKGRIVKIQEDPGAAD